MKAHESVVIVTGAASGIGAAAADQLARRGVVVVRTDIAFGRSGSSVVSSSEREVKYRADVSLAADAEALIALVLDRFGRIDGLFNNAGVEGPILPIGEYPEDDFGRVMGVNVKAAWLMTKHAAPALGASCGAVVNTASTAGLMGWPNLAPYVASKHAVIGLTRALAAEFAESGIRVNAICPGPTNTRMLQKIGEANAPGDPDEAMRMQIENVPARRLAEPDEIAQVAAWLLLDAPSFLTGATIAVDGGQTSCYGNSPSRSKLSHVREVT